MGPAAKNGCDVFRGGRKKSPHHFVDVDKMVGIVVSHPALLVVAIILPIGNDDVVNEENPHRFARLFQSERQTVVITAWAVVATRMVVYEGERSCIV